MTTMTGFVSVDDVKDEEAAFTKVLAFISTFTTVTFTIAALVGSKSLSLVTSLLGKNEERQVGLHLRALGAAFHLITNGFHMFAFWLQCNSVVSLSFGMSSILQCMNQRIIRGGCHQSYANISRTGKQFMADYRAMGVLQAHFAALYRHYISVVQTTSIFCVFFDTYQAVTRGSIRSILLSFAVCFGHIQFIQATAQVYDNSCGALKSWKLQHRRDLPPGFSRFLKSCRNLSVPMGNSFFVDRRLVLTVLAIMTNASASLILAH